MFALLDSHFITYVQKMINQLPNTASQHHCSELTSNCKGSSNNSIMDAKEAMGKSPGEVAFFKVLHAELKKAIHFFGRAEEEFIIREERVREGIEITKRPKSLMIPATTTMDRWSMVSKSLYRMYKDLLLLETFAIMTYCSFSKILKKHDKVTGYDTRCAFMKNVVDKANFSNYPRTLEMLQRTQALYEKAIAEIISSTRNNSNNSLQCNNNRSKLHEDERLFINMIRRLNEQAMDTAEAEGAPDTILLRSKENRAAEVKNSNGSNKVTDCSIPTSPHTTEIKLLYCPKEESHPESTNSATGKNRYEYSENDIKDDECSNPSKKTRFDNNHLPR